MTMRSALAGGARAGAGAWARAPAAAAKSTVARRKREAWWFMGKLGQRARRGCKRGDAHLSASRGEEKPAAIPFLGGKRHLPAEARRRGEKSEKGERRLASVGPLGPTQK